MPSFFPLLLAAATLSWYYSLGIHPQQSQSHRYFNHTTPAVDGRRKRLPLADACTNSLIQSTHLADQACASMCSLCFHRAKLASSDVYSPPPPSHTRTSPPPPLPLHPTALPSATCLEVASTPSDVMPRGTTLTQTSIARGPTCFACDAMACVATSGSATTTELRACDAMACVATSGSATTTELRVSPRRGQQPLQSCVCRNGVSNHYRAACLRRDGVCRHVGVSNHYRAAWDRLVAGCRRSHAGMSDDDSAEATDSHLLPEANQLFVARHAPRVRLGPASSV
jgi:hypothetical protein